MAVRPVDLRRRIVGLVQQPLADGPGDRFDAFLVALGGGLPASLVLREDPIDERIAVLAQGGDRGQRLELAEPASEAPDLLLDDLLRR